MAEANLSREELVALVSRVFDPQPADRALAVLVDLPDAQVPDCAAWADRRTLAVEWAALLAASADELGLEVACYCYRNVRANNAELPAVAFRHRGGALPGCAEELDAAAAEPFSAVLGAHDLILAPTQFSATAPLKLGARELGFRAATMPGFSREMIPALRLDYGVIDHRVQRIKGLLDRATRAELRFVVDGATQHHLTLDLRYRTAHASGGLLRARGTAGNLPSGEAYIVPYEGERAGDPSVSAGELPVQLGGEVVVYAIEHNRALGVAGEGERARAEAAHLAREPAYGNLAELGLGVLADLGVQPIGELLLDEKLGLHVAFGRSDHFGGQVGPRDFSRPEEVVHLDHVYVRAMQPRIGVRAVELQLEDGELLPLIRDDRYVVAF